MVIFVRGLVVALVLATSGNTAAAQAQTKAGGAPQTGHRDSVWNGTLIGLGAGIGSAAALDAVFCDNGFGGCDAPWAAYLTLGGIGAGAGAGIDWLIGRKSAARPSALHVSPILGGTRKGIRASLTLPDTASLPALAKARQSSRNDRRDSVWDGALIGAAVGAGSGYIWARNMCGSNDSECFAIAGGVGILGGAGIGTAVGAIADALHK